MEEEQEREIDHEVERERQIERPARAVPMSHSIHPDVRYFVQTGIIRPDSRGFVPLFSPLASIDPRIRRAWSSKLLSTKDFSVTIHSVRILDDQDFLRPVNWIVSNELQDLVVLSPFEVNELLPEIRRSKKIHLHMYTPRTTQSMRSFDDLQFHCIPPLPRSWTLPESLVRSQLNIWAGQLYLRDYSTFVELCQFLGIDTPENRIDHEKLYGAGVELQVQKDGFVLPRHRGEGTAMQVTCRFTSSPIHFIRRLLGLRRKGMSFLPSHMGKLIHASLLRWEDFDEVNSPS